MFSKINNITYLKNEPLSQHCSFKVGGPAKHFIYTCTIDALLDVLSLCKQHSLKYKIIGGGSNMLFDDQGFDGVLIKYNNDFIDLKNGLLQASSGCSLIQLIKKSQDLNLCGFEFSLGIPAQLGGAVVNNIGAYGQEISTYIDRVTILKNNQITYLPKQMCNFDYHSSNLQNKNIVVLGATFNLPQQDQNVSKQQMLECFNTRKNSQPLEYPNAGSIFKRSSNIVPAQLIDQLGLKGLTVGNAQVSTKHAGFIINRGNAKCRDILKLIEIIKTKIYEKYNTNLQLEIEYLPFV